VSAAIHTDAFLPHPPEKVWRALGGGWRGHLARRLEETLSALD